MEYTYDTVGNRKPIYGEIKLKCDSLSTPKDTSNIMNDFFNSKQKDKKISAPSLIDNITKQSNMSNTENTKENTNETNIFKDSVREYYNDVVTNDDDKQQYAVLNNKLKSLLQELKINSLDDFENFLDTGITRFLREKEREKDVKLNYEEIEQTKANVELFEQWLILALQSDDSKARQTAKYYYILHQDELDNFIIDIVIKRKGKNKTKEDEDENKIFSSLIIEKNKYRFEVIQTFKLLIDRDPNPSELSHYTNMLKFRIINIERIEEILKDTDEYKEKLEKDRKLENKVIDIQTKSVDQRDEKEQYNVLHDDDYHINIINSAYEEILKRKVDENGLRTYLTLMRNGMPEEKLQNILRSSQEYKDKFGDSFEDNRNSTKNIIYNTTIHSDTVPSFPKIVYCMMGTNRLVEIKPYIESVLPYIDKFIFIDGGSEDGTVKYLESLNDQGNNENKENKVEVYIYPWQDRFSAQRNNYLKKLKERDYNGFVITSDTDEHFSVESLIKIREIIPELERTGINAMLVQVIDVIVDDDDYNKEISRTKNEYWKQLVFKYDPNLRYEGEPHETLVGSQIKSFQSNITYEHRRSKLHIFQRATENYFISNSNRYSERWAEFRFLCTRYRILNFKEYWKLFIDHKLPDEIENWIRKHKDDNFDSGDSELREMYQLYFDILPERRKKKDDTVLTNIAKGELSDKTNDVSLLSQEMSTQSKIAKLVGEIKRRKMTNDKMNEIRIQILDEGYLILLKKENNKCKQFGIGNIKLVIEKVEEILNSVE